MTEIRDELERREKLARSAIKKVYGTEEDEYGATLFISHHFEELDTSYWQEHLGTEKPEPQDILNILELKTDLGFENEEDLDTLDFTLPCDVTNYVICVEFDEDGNVESVTMES